MFLFCFLPFVLPPLLCTFCYRRLAEYGYSSPTNSSVLIILCSSSLLGLYASICYYCFNCHPDCPLHALGIRHRGREWWPEVPHPPRTRRSPPHPPAPPGTPPHPPAPPRTPPATPHPQTDKKNGHNKNYRTKTKNQSDNFGSILKSPLHSFSGSWWKTSRRLNANFNQVFSV